MKKKLKHLLKYGGSALMVPLMAYALNGEQENAANEPYPSLERIENAAQTTSSNSIENYAAETSPNENDAQEFPIHHEEDKSAGGDVWRIESEEKVKICEELNVKTAQNEDLEKKIESNHKQALPEVIVSPNINVVTCTNITEIVTNIIKIMTTNVIGASYKELMRESPRLPYSIQLSLPFIQMNNIPMEGINYSDARRKIIDGIGIFWGKRLREGSWVTGNSGAYESLWSGLADFADDYLVPDHITTGLTKFRKTDVLKDAGTEQSSSLETVRFDLDILMNNDITAAQWRDYKILLKSIVGGKISHYNLKGVYTVNGKTQELEGEAAFASLLVGMGIDILRDNEGTGYSLSLARKFSGINLYQNGPKGEMADDGAYELRVSVNQAVDQWLGRKRK